MRIEAEGVSSRWRRPEVIAPWVLFTLALVARLVAWPYSDVVDADAVSRALTGESYMHYPGWASDGVWPPLHFYLNGLFTVICGSRVIGSVLVNILLGSALVFPVFAFVRRWSRTAVATAVSLIVVFEPLVFRDSLQGLSEVPFLFFTACAFNALSIAQSDPSSRGNGQAVLAGLFISTACGMRYEAWVLIVPLLLFLALSRRWWRLLLFVVPALVFPVAWMITNHMAHGNMFQGLEPVVHWQGNAIVAKVPEKELLLRSAFFPVSFLLALSPIVVLLGVAGTAKALAGCGSQKHRWPWLLLFPLFLALMVAKARNAELLLQHRFTMTLVLLFIPYLMFGFALLRSRTLILLLSLFFATWSFCSSMSATGPAWLRWAAGTSATGEALAYIQQNTLGELKPVPILDHRLPDALVQAIDAIRMDRKLLVLDFLGWQDTYNVAFRADRLATSFVFLPPKEAGFEQGAEQLQSYLYKLHNPHGVLVLDEEGAYYGHIDHTSAAGPTLTLPSTLLVLTPAGHVGHVALFTFETKN